MKSTGIDKNELIKLNEKCNIIPDNFVLHPGIKYVILLVFI